MLQQDINQQHSSHKDYLKVFLENVPITEWSARLITPNSFVLVIVEQNLTHLVQSTHLSWSSITLEPKSTLFLA